MFCHITQHAAFNQQLSLADEGYESGSDTINLPTPLQKTPHIHHISSMEHMLHSTQFSPHLAVHHKLHLDQCADAYLLALQTTAFQTALQHAQTAQVMKKKISRWYPWMMNTGLSEEETPERTLCIHEHMDYCMNYAITHVLTCKL